METAHQPTPRTVSAGDRIGSMILDHVFMSLISILFMVPGIIAGLSGMINSSNEPEQIGLLDDWWLYTGLFGFSLYACKDVLNGRSIAKRILKLQVVNNKTGLPASPIRCYVRNLINLLWVVELIIVLINPARRIGDRLAGTKVVAFDPSAEQPEIRWKNVVLTILLSYGLILLLTLPILASLNELKPDYVESSYNRKLSREIEQMYNDSLGEYMTAEVKVYDKMNSGSKKYVYISFTLNEKYDSKYFDNSVILKETRRLLQTRLPEDTYTGRVNCKYKSNHSFKISSSTLN